MQGRAWLPRPLLLPLARIDVCEAWTLRLVADGRERNDGLYTPLTYLSAKLVEEVIVALLVSIISSNIVFWACEFAGSWALFWFTAFLTTVVGIGARTPPHMHSLVMKP